MKATDSIHNPFITAGLTLPKPPRFEGFGSNPRHARQPNVHAPGRFDVTDAEGRLPEIVCRIMLGLCLAYTFVVCLIQLAAS